MSTPPLGANAQDVLRTVGPQADAIGTLWNGTLVLCAVVFLAVLVATLLALRRSGRGDARTPADVSGLVRAEQGPRRAVALGVAASVAGLFGLLGASVATDRAMARMPLAGALHVELTGHQWWWSVRYDDADASRVFVTANELHVPVGRPVILTLRSDDVIHSLWVPNLAGKKDLIPGRTATQVLRADQPGVFRAPCAEFCGHQHAWMALTVTAEPPGQFEAWAAQQRRPAPAPRDPIAERGRQVFMGSTCVMCHAVVGTEAGAQAGPDLTHVGSRPTLGAGALPNDARHLAAWISNPHAHKPGVNMPGHAFAEDDLQALVAWLGSLK